MSGERRESKPPRGLKNSHNSETLHSNIVDCCSLDYKLHPYWHCSASTMKGWLCSSLAVVVWNHEAAPVESFLHTQPNLGRLVPQSRPTRLRRYSFLDNILSGDAFKDMFGKAFENDSKLSQDDKLRGMIIEGPGDDDDVSSVSRNWSPTLTATQEKWRRMQKGPDNASLEGKKAEMDFYLTGVPDKDPSSDLYGAKENISSRDRKLGQAAPQEPTISAISVEFLPESKCRANSTSSFTTADSEGEWRVSEDGKQVRFRIPVSGYSRTVQTKGSIQKIYWSDEAEKSTQTSTTYTIQAGWLYGEATLTTNVRGDMQWSDGILKVELSMGLLGAASRMIPCGKFVAKTSSSYSTGTGNS